MTDWPCFLSSVKVQYIMIESIVEKILFISCLRERSRVERREEKREREPRVCLRKYP